MSEITMPRVNELPYMRGLWRTRRSPYPYKECWPEADFGDRWRALKTRLRAEPPAAPAAESAGAL